MYRVLAANAEVRERRNQLRHPHIGSRNCSPPAPTRSGAETSLSSSAAPRPGQVDYYYLSGARCAKRGSFAREHSGIRQQDQAAYPAWDDLDKRTAGG